MQIIDDNYLPLGDAAFYSGYSYYVLYNALVRGDLQGIFFRGRWYVNKDSLNIFKPNPVGRPRK